MTNNKTDPNAEHDETRVEAVDVMIEESIIREFQSRYGDRWKEALERAITEAADKLE
jgi:hypothetical protein